MQRLDHYWNTRNPVAWVLLPLGLLFCVVATLRRMLYRAGILSSTRLPVPVVIVGNITVGGTGKTPLIIALCELLAQRGLKAGVVSRGYGARIEGEHRVAENDTADICGDEPLLIKQRTGCDVVIGADRVAAARKLLAESDCDLILSDDGMQHYRLKRDIEIAVIDGNRKFGNGFCLPAGPLREPVSRLKHTDMQITQGTTDDTYHFDLVISDAVNLVTQERRGLASFSHVHAVAGIGHPQRFFNQLRSIGLELHEHAFADHYRYSANDLEFGDDLPVLMTEKDAVKCKSFQNRKLWSVPATTILSYAFKNDFLERVESIK